MGGKALNLNDNSSRITAMHRDLARNLRKNMTDAERWMWYHIRKKQFAGYRFRRQAPIGPFIVDFVCFGCKLILELDGGQHATQRDEDARRTRWLESQGFRVLRFWNNQVLQEWDSVAQVIWNELQRLTPHPCPSPTRGEGNEGHPSPTRGEGEDGHPFPQSGRG